MTDSHSASMCSRRSHPPHHPLFLFLFPYETYPTFSINSGNLWSLYDERHRCWERKPPAWDGQRPPRAFSPTLPSINSPTGVGTDPADKHDARVIRMGQRNGANFSPLYYASLFPFFFPLSGELPSLFPDTGNHTVQAQHRCRPFAERGILHADAAEVG